MKTNVRGWLVTGLLMMIALIIGLLLPRFDLSIFGQAPTPTVESTTAPTLTPSETFPPSSPLPSLTPSQTLLPPPTFEPPTLTPIPSATPSITPTATIFIDAPAPAGLRGAETATPTSEVGCEKNDEWQLRYEVQPNDALANIASLYNTSVQELADGNCLEDANLIRAGQQLRVPGDVQPNIPEIECLTWEVLTPFNGAFTVEGEGQLTFNWRGPLSPRNLIRVIQPDGEIWERLVEMRQNETIDLFEELPQSGVHTWYVYPLGMDFLQIPCPEGGPWTFNKAEAPDPTEVPAGGGGFG